MFDLLLLGSLFFLIGVVYIYIKLIREPLLKKEEESRFYSNDSIYHHQHSRYAYQKVPMHLARQDHHAVRRRTLSAFNPNNPDPFHQQTTLEFQGQPIPSANHAIAISQNSPTVQDPGIDPKMQQNHPSPLQSYPEYYQQHSDYNQQYLHPQSPPPSPYSMEQTQPNFQSYQLQPSHHQPLQHQILQRQEQLNLQQNYKPLWNSPLHSPLPSPEKPPVFPPAVESSLSSVDESLSSQEDKEEERIKLMAEGPAKIQIEVARRARIPLFVKTPLYSKRNHLKKEGNENAIEMKTIRKKEEKLKEVDERNSNLQAEDKPSAIKIIPKKEQPIEIGRIPNSNNNLHIDYSDIKLGKLIGQGAFGAVHKGVWRGTNVAVKLLVSQQLSQEILDEFEAEVQIMSVLRHPNIVMLMGACLDPPTRYLVVELVAMGSLWCVLRQKISIEYNKQHQFCLDTAQGMNYLHSFKPPILHRDLKSPNLLVDNSFNIKISDFGLARVRAHFQTMTGNCGTVQWMAPEVLAAQNYTEKADIFSFGIVCWETVTRLCPYDGLNAIQVALGVLNNNLRPVIPPNCPPLLKRLMSTCWSTNPEKRPSFEEILYLLNKESPHETIN